MREFKFRGLNINGEWCYGLLSISQGYSTQPKAGHYISNRAGCPWAYHVIPETVSLWTGFTDKNDKEIYENDIVLSAGGREVYEVILNKSGYKLKPLQGTQRMIGIYPHIKRQTLIGRNVQ